jgi:sugar phosphate isomerase/epimerase
VIRLACASWSFGVLDLERAAGVVAALGFGAIDVGFHHLPTSAASWSAREGEALAETLTGHGLELSDLFPLLPFEVNDPDPSRRRENRACFERVLAFARAAGAPGVTLKPGEPQASTQDGGWQVAATELGALAGRAHAAGVPLSIEPHVGSLVETPERVTRMLAQVPGLRLTLDYSHFVCVGVPVDAPDVLLPHARHVHVRQARVGRLQVPARSGEIDYARVLGLLEHVGYRGFATCEYQHSDWHDCNDVDVVTETVATLELLGRAPARS